MKFYRVESTEFLEDSLGAYTFFVVPEGLTSFLKMFEKYKETYSLNEPELVEIDLDENGKPIRPPGERNICLFVGT